MNMEDIIRRRHEFEDRLRIFMSEVQYFKEQALSLEIRMLEIGMARAYDLMNQTAAEALRIDRMFKGHLFKSVYNAKQNGEKTSLWKRMKKGVENFSRVPLAYPLGRDPIALFINFKFSYPVTVTEELVLAWATGDSGKWCQLLPSGES